MAAPASSFTVPLTSEEVVCANAAAAPSRSAKMTEDNLLIFLTLLVDTPRLTRPPPGRRRPSVCVQRIGFVGGEGIGFVFPETTTCLKGNPHARERTPYLSVGEESPWAFEVGEFGKAIQTI